MNLAVGLLYNSESFDADFIADYWSTLRASLTMPKRAKNSYPLLDLVIVCKRIHDYWWNKKNRKAAKRQKHRLEQILRRIPSNDISIIKQEGLAWLHQLKGNTRLAIKYRKKEIDSMERLHEIIRQDHESGRIKKSTVDYALQGRGLAVLRNRKAILKGLLKEKLREHRVMRKPRT